MLSAQDVVAQDPRTRLMLWATCVGMLTLGTNGTAIMAALPNISHELGLNAAQIGWAINAYLIVSAACIIPGGKAADWAGAQRISMAGLMLFAMASIVVATAPSPAFLLAGRALQGLAAALAVPATLAAISQASTLLRRAAAMGAWAGFLMLGFSVGPLIGGALTHYVGWRVIFWVSSVAMFAATIGFVISHGAAPASRTEHIGRFDWTGFGLLAIFMAAVIWALHAVPTVTRAPSNFVGFAALAATACAALLATERRARDPLIDLDLFTRDAFVRAVVTGSMAMSSILGFLLYYNLDAQSSTGLSLTPIGAGLSLLPMSGGLLIFAFSAPWLMHRFGPRRVLIGGMLLTACASTVIAVAVAGRMWAPLIIGLFAIGAGLALPYATAPRLALSILPPTRAGAGSGIINACTFLGGSIGVAGGGVAFALGGVSGVMGLIAVCALIGAWVSRGMAASA
jgi:MFS family permease